MRYTTRFIVPPKVRRSGLLGGKENRYAPQVIGVRKSFGFGDLLGLTTPGQVRAAAAHRDWSPFFAQGSTEELARTGRNFQEVMRASAGGLEKAGFRQQPWGADADRLKQPFQADNAAGADFTYFTIDPSEFIRHEADTLSAGALAAAIEEMLREGELPENWSESYVGKFIDLPGDLRLELTLEPVQRAAVKFGRAVQHSARMYEAIARACQGRPFEIEVCLDSVATPATSLEHLFVGLELEARQVRVTSLGLRLAVAPREDGTPGEPPAEFEERMRGHVAVAEFCGPYKLSFRGGEDQFGLYPSIGRLCGEHLHVKTAGTSYLEALRTVLRTDAALFMEIVRCSEGSAGGPLPGGGGDAAATESIYLDTQPGRRFLLAAYGAVLKGGRTAAGRSLKEGIVETLGQNASLHEETVAARYEQHLRLLAAG